MLYQDLLSQVGPDYWLVTVNERLARFLWQAKLQPGQVLLHERVQSWQSLSKKLWQQVEWLIPGAPSLMSATQSLLLWQDLIDNSRDEHLLFSAETAKIAREAWVLHKKWMIPLSEVASYGANPCFVEWCEAFELRCATLSLHDEADLLSLLIQAVPQVVPLLPEQLKLIGFDDIPPQLEHLMGLLREQGIQSEFCQSSVGTATVQVVAAPNREEEFYQACHRSKQLLEQNPQAVAAIVLPDLEIQREVILKIAQSVFLGPPAPSYHAVHDWPFTLSGGQPLSMIPMIAHALLSLKMPITQQYDDWSLWLRSPFILGAEIEQIERLKLDLALREQLNQKISFMQMNQVIFEIAALDSLKTMLGILKKLDLKQRLTFSKWRQVVYYLLDSVGWPGSLPLDSSSHQAVLHFYRVIDELCQLDGVSSAVLYAEYMKRLFTAVSEVSFSPESSVKARCHILGGLEAAGLYFDHIWFCGLSDDAWPKEPSPNPFIPFVLARQYDIPRSSNVRELKFSKNMMQRFSGACHTLVLSYPKTQRGLVSYPSPLLSAYGAAQHLACFDRFELRALRARPVLDFMVDEQAPVIQESQLLSIQGGGGIIRSQAVCPFQAFAKYRLKAAAIKEPQSMINLQTRGLLLHEVLENIWKILGTQSALIAKTEQELSELIHRTLNRALQHFAQKDRVMFSPSWCSIEYQRLSQLLKEWMALECERPGFRVLEIEKTILLTIQGLPLKIRLDRVDQMDSGQCMIIDYKTGQVSPKDWFGEIILAPQLPLYATVYDADGLAFAKLHQKECRLVGVASDDSLEPLIAIAELGYADATNWEDQKKNWRTGFNRLVTEFIEGDARVAPCSPESACRYCDLQSLCRIREKESLL